MEVTRLTQHMHNIILLYRIGINLICISFYLQASELKLSGYKNVVVRVQFPDQIILQGVFTPSNTIQDVMNFIKQHLEEPDKPFLICKCLVGTN